MFWSSIFATAMFPVVVVALLLALDRRKRRLGEEKRDMARLHRTVTPGRLPEELQLARLPLCLGS